MVNEETIKKKVKRIEDTLTSMEKGSYADMPISWVNNQIDWLYKFRYIDHNKMVELVNRSINVMELYRYD